VDVLLTPLMDDLLACVCTALADTVGGTPTCACTLMPGTVAPANWCSCGGRGDGCGMAWVRLDRMFPSSRFPAQDTSANACTTLVAAVLEVGTYRCQPVGDAKGNPPSVVDVTNAVLTQNDDAMALLEAIRCCESIKALSSMLGLWTPRDGGGCGGGAWQVTVAPRPARATTPAGASTRRPGRDT
jgi:hypothetical protein